MASPWVFGLLVLAFASCSLVQADGDAVVLTPDNFDDNVGGSQAALVEFYAPWCGHCKKLAPEWEVLGSAFKKIPSVVIGKVDCDEHKDLCGKFGVSGFPTIKYFPKNSQQPEDYSGGRTADDLITFVNQKAGTKAKVKKEPSYVTILDKSSFEKIVLDPSKNVLVEFYAPWCGHCKSLAPTYEQLAKVYAGEPNVVIANLDADNADHKDLASKYGVSGFPTLMWFSADDKEPVRYESGRDLASFVSYINEKAGTHRTESGGLTDEAGVVESLTETVKDFLAAGSDTRQDIYDKAVEAVKTLTSTQVPYGQTYLKIMKSILDKGSEYVTKESGRLERLLKTTLSPQKETEFSIRKNILRLFN
ncbi:protein disulfide-isomerase A6 [Klebsormidium nitens]|uniref:protein disulfide-isomerase n=1 Tax=Klebsormidium nitens TaxID=105231 RepID=A0A1Y1I1J5_KLENI|nr:protein disulfide-isomerase A6 [Klebsormidium nitens]|eukprot:GAQ84784.1 protein disulfide-isomerase A6 [Klebsormidium nitens]